jgi:tetratricopeptide (TPR) repeat protein
MIYRHIAELAESVVPDIAIDALEKSLKLDPLDQPSYIKLIRLNEQDGELKDAQEWLDKGLSRFPKDVELLGLAMNAASRRKAFKKAAAYAKTVLEIDPINSPARHFLIAAHLGHARKQYKTGRYDLAQQELTEARALDIRRRNASLSFLEGFLALKQAGTKPAHELFAEGWQLAGDPLNAQLLLNMETLSLNLTASAIKSSVPGLDKNYIAKPSELLGLVQRIARDYADEKKLLPEALKSLKPVLKKSFKQPGLTEEDYFNLCQALVRCAQFELLGDCAKESAQRFPMAAGPIYFSVYADCKGVATRITAGQEHRLDLAMQRAQLANDHRVGLLIQKFFEALDEADEFEFDEDFLPELQNFESKMTPDFQKRMMELDTLPKAKLADMLAKAMPGLPLKHLSHDDLLNMARMMLMDEMGVDVQRLLGGAIPFDPIKKLPKSR